jgi:mannose-6-phosphate isomerase-like protein (cupin superfamily)
MAFQTMALPLTADVTAPDGSEVRVLLASAAGSMAHFRLAPRQISKPVTHRTVEEIWYVLEGEGQMWRKLDGIEETVAVSAGTCLTIPLGTHFQFRASGDGELSAIGVAMPPWPGEAEATPVEGPWTPSRP